MRKKFQAQLFQSIDVSSFVFFRIAFGAIMIREVWRYYEYNRIARYYVDPDFFFSYLNFIQPLWEMWMNIVFILLAILGGFMLVGFKYRWSAIGVFLLFTYIFLLDRAQYLNHFYLISLVSFAMIFAPAATSFSIDSYLGSVPRSQYMLARPLWLLRFLVAIPYFFGGVAKIHADRFTGFYMIEPAKKLAELPIIGSLFLLDAAPQFLARSALVFDLAIVPLLLRKKTRVPAFILALVFNLCNAYMFNIGVFPWFMIAGTLLFFDPDRPKQIIWKFMEVKRTPSKTSKITKKRKNMISTLLLIFMFGHIVLPFRHLVYSWDVNRTEEWHRFSWHMKLRKKYGAATFYIKKDGVISEIDQTDFLSTRQIDKMRKRPDMLLQFAHHLEEVYKKDIEVYAIVLMSLNGRSHRLLLDPARDLTEIHPNIFQSLAKKDRVFDLNASKAIDYETTINQSPLSEVYNK